MLTRLRLTRFRTAHYAKTVQIEYRPARLATIPADLTRLTTVQADLDGRLARATALCDRHPQDLALRLTLRTLRQHQAGCLSLYNHLTRVHLLAEETRHAPWPVRPRACPCGLVLLRPVGYWIAYSLPDAECLAWDGTPRHAVYDRDGALEAVGACTLQAVAA